MPRNEVFVTHVIVIYRYNLYTCSIFFLTCNKGFLRLVAQFYNSLVSVSLVSQISFNHSKLHKRMGKMVEKPSTSELKNVIRLIFEETQPAVNFEKHCSPRKLCVQFVPQF